MPGVTSWRRHIVRSSTVIPTVLVCSRRTKLGAVSWHGKSTKRIKNKTIPFAFVCERNISPMRGLVSEPVT